MSHFIIFDLEYTTWEGAMQRGWSGEKEYREVVQIGALKIDRETLKVIDVLNLLVKPKINPLLSEYFQKLTHISQDQLDSNGISFPEAYDRFAEFCESELVFSYGNDMFVLGENVALNKNHPTATFERESGMAFANIGPYIIRAAPESATYNSGRLWQCFNLPKPHEADEHDALFDCYSILAAIRHLIGQGVSLPL